MKEEPFPTPKISDADIPSQMKDIYHSEEGDHLDISQVDALLAEFGYESGDFSADDPKEKDAAIAEKKPEEKKQKKPVRKWTGAFPKKKAVLFSCIGAGILVLCIALVFLIGAALDPYDSRILPNTTIGGIPVGGMTRMEAYQTLKDATAETFSQQPMVITLPDETITLSPDNTRAKLRVWSAVSSAYRHGRKGSEQEIQAAVEASQGSGYNVDMLPYIKINQDYIRTQLEAYAAAHNVSHTELSYHLSGEQPALEENLYDPSAPTQTLELTLGTPKEELDVDAVLADILNAYSFNTFSLSIESIPYLTTPKAPDLDALYEEFYIAPVNTTLDMKTYQQIPGSYGYDFEMDAAKALLSQAQYGDTVSIPMTYVKPEILGDEAYFRDELGYCETPHGDNANRNTNLQLACASLDGMILQPGEEFSYNNALGERTKEKGYKPAPAYSGTNLVDSLGGGICQVSSTLYCATLYADMEIVFRINHGFRSSYIGLGLDATVSWGKPDFQFRNNSNFPIMIKAEDTDGYVKIKIMGTEERDYYIKMTSGYSEDEDSIYCWTYKNKYDRETDELISKEKEAYSRYSK